MTSSTTDWNALCTTITTNYSKTLEENLNRRSPIMDLLESKMKAAQKEMASELEHQLWGDLSTNSRKELQGLRAFYPQEYPKAERQKDMRTNPALRKCIEDAYDEVMKRKADEMTSTNDAVEKAVAARKEARATDILNKLDGVFEAITDGLIVWTEVYPTNPDKTYRGAAVKSDEFWYRTNVNGRFDTEGLKAVIAEKALDGVVRIEGSGVDL